MSTERKKNLKEQLLNSGSTEAQLQLLNSYIAELRLRRKIVANPAVWFITQQMKKGVGNAPLHCFRNDLGLTDRSFQRLFSNYVGVSPRMYNRICKFDQTFRSINGAKFSNLLDVASENEFSDQSHFTRVFREFTGYSPRDYIKSCVDFRSRLALD